MCTYTEITSIQKKEDTTKPQEKNIYFKLSSKHNVDILGITLSIWKNMTLKLYSLLIMLWTLNIPLERYLVLDKYHNIWERMIILVLLERIYHMQHLNMDLENLSFKYIFTDRHIVLQKTGSYTRKTGKIRSRSNVLF